jgi:SOS-response transcriptional repressor LexA
MSIRKIELKRTSPAGRRAVGKRIGALRGKDSLAAFGARLGVAHTTIKRYEEGAMLPSADVLMRISSLFGKSVSWLMTGKEDATSRSWNMGKEDATSRSGEMGEALTRPEVPVRLPEDEYFSVPLVNGEIAAGEPIITSEDIIEWVVIHVRPVKKAVSTVRDLVACRVRGESMSPYLASDDIVVIDRGADKERIVKGRIYAVWDDGGITAKLLQKEGEKLFLLPLNNEERIRIIDLRLNPIPVVGLVIGGWRNFTRPL